MDNLAEPSRFSVWSDLAQKKHRARAPRKCARIDGMQQRKMLMRDVQRSAHVVAKGPLWSHDSLFSSRTRARHQEMGRMFSKYIFASQLQLLL